jgi:hypothetical protein
MGRKQQIFHCLEKGRHPLCPELLLHIGDDSTAESGTGDFRGAFHQTG